MSKVSWKNVRSTRHRLEVKMHVGLFACGACTAIACVEETESTTPASRREAVTSQLQVYYSGIDEVVTHVFSTDEAGITHKRLVRADGSLSKMTEVLADEQRARERKFGRMTPSLAEHLAQVEGIALVDVGIVFDPAIDEARFDAIGSELREEELERGNALRAGVVTIDHDGKLDPREGSDRGSRVVARFNERGPLEREQAHIVDDAVRVRRRSLRDQLSARGYDIDPAESTTPILYVRLPARDVHALATTAGVSWLFEAGSPTGAEFAAPNGMAFHKIDTGMNAAPNNLDGNGQKVGLIENSHCAIHDAHDAFELAPGTQYNNTSYLKPCTSDADCATSCKSDPTSDPGVCRILKNGLQRCVDPHLSQVASQIWGTRFEAGSYKNYGAGRATPYVWVGSSAAAPETNCNVAQTQLAYDWFNTSGVKTVVGSYGCSSTGVDGFIEDWNAARRDIAIFKATPSGNATDSGCRAANAICVGGMYSAHGTIDGWQNPSVGLNFYLDREKPDVVAFAGGRSANQIDVIDLSSTSNWTQSAGSSFANPLVANIATLVRQRCGAPVDARYMRALLMASSWYYDPEDSSVGGLAFSTQPKPGVAINMMLPGYISTGFPGFGFDYRDGAGGPTDYALGFCGGGPGGVTFDGGPITVGTTGGAPFTRPSGSGGTYNLVESDDDDEAPQETFSYDNSDLFQVWNKVFTLGANTRIRAVFTWDKCTPTGASGPGAGPYNVTSMTEDFDLFLCPTSGGACVAESRSVYDNKEGFDITVANAGNYRLSVVYDDSATSGCNGSASAPAAYAWVAGNAASFVEAP